MPANTLHTCPRAALLFMLVALTFSARAGENQLGYSYGSETESKGEAEVYQWVTQRSGKAAGSYEATDFATEFEYGLTDRLDAELELSGSRFRARGVQTLDDVDRTNFTGLAAALKYAVRDVDRDGYGLAVYLEPEFSKFDHVAGDREEAFGLETKVIFQKERGPWTYIANVTAEPELVKEHGATTHELEAVFSHGLSRRIARHWYVGVENVWRAEFEPLRLTRWSRYAVNVGPTIHFECKTGWVTLTWLPQVAGWPASRRGLELDDFERNEVRLKFGCDL